MLSVFVPSIRSLVLCGTCTVLMVVVLDDLTESAISLAFLLDSDADTEEGLKLIRDPPPVFFNSFASFFTSFSVFCNIAKISSSSSSLDCVVAAAEYIVGAEDSDEYLLLSVPILEGAD